MGQGINDSTTKIIFTPTNFNINTLQTENYTKIERMCPQDTNTHV